MIKCSSLKSDHCGIEINIFIYDRSFFFKIKIRPLWDWNNGAIYIIRVYQSTLKSDHCGIEIYVVVNTMTINEKLKSDHCGIEMFSH